MLIGCLECEGFGDAWRGMEEVEVNARWRQDVAPFCELPAGLRPGTGFLGDAEIFDPD